MEQGEKERLLIEHLPKIRWVAKSQAKYCKSFTQDDLLQIGAIAFLENIEKADPAKTDNLWNYMWWRVMGAMKREIHMFDDMIHIPDNARKRGWLPFQFDEISACDFECFKKIIGIEDLDAQENMKTVLYDASMKDGIRATLATLTNRERNVIEYRYGFKDGKQYTLDECGAVFGVTRERVRQIEAKALRKLRHPSRVYGMKGILE